MTAERIYTFDIRDPQAALHCHAAIRAISKAVALQKIKQWITSNPLEETFQSAVHLPNLKDMEIVFTLDADKVTLAHICDVRKIEPAKVAVDKTERGRELYSPARVITIGMIKDDTQLLEIWLSDYPIDWVHIYPGTRSTCPEVRALLRPDYDLMIVYESSLSQSRWRDDIVAVHPPGDRRIRPIKNGDMNWIKHQILTWYEGFNQRTRG